MLFVRCPDCGKKYFSNSTNCPECGALNRSLEDMERKAHPYDIDEGYMTREEKRRIEEHDHIQPYKNMYKNDETYDEKATRPKAERPKIQQRPVQNYNTQGQRTGVIKVLVVIFTVIITLNFILPLVFMIVGSNIFDAVKDEFKNIPGISIETSAPIAEGCPEGYILDENTCVKNSLKETDEQLLLDKFLDDTWYVGYVYNDETEEAIPVEEYWMTGIVPFDDGEVYFLADESNGDILTWKQYGSIFDMYKGDDLYAVGILDIEEEILVIQFTDSDETVLLVQESYYEKGDETYE